MKDQIARLGGRTAAPRLVTILAPIAVTTALRPPAIAASGDWTWISGANTVGQAGIYGTQGVPDPANVPGARQASVSWIDASDGLWLFAGYGKDSAGSTGYLNDLWRYGPTTGQWTWISGSDIRSQAGVYGTKGTPDPANVPGARYMSVSRIDASGRLCLFGGRLQQQPQHRPAERSMALRAAAPSFPRLPATLREGGLKDQPAGRATVLTTPVRLLPLTPARRRWCVAPSPTRG